MSKKAADVGACDIESSSGGVADERSDKTPELRDALCAEARRLGFDPGHASDEEIYRLSPILSNDLRADLEAAAATTGCSVAAFTALFLRPLFEHDPATCADCTSWHSPDRDIGSA